MARAGKTALEPRARRHFGVIDIGSNSIRLVVFDALWRSPHPIFNEKVICGLGQGLERTGSLDPAGVALALDNLGRFAALAQAMDVKELEVLATAAVRDAANGPEFAASVAKLIKSPVRILSGPQEARLSALGVISGIPDADGLMGDLGGGSLELVALDAGRLGQHATLPVGPLRLRDIAEKGRKSLREAIDQHLGALPWIGSCRGRTFFAVGGAWRTLARIHMGQIGYPLRVIHHYTVAYGKALDFLDLVAGMSRAQLARIEPAARKRTEVLPIAALVLNRLMQIAMPSRLVFSSTGLREGSLYQRLAPRHRRLDPLIEGCRAITWSSARFDIDSEALLQWLEPVFAGEAEAGAAEARRLRQASCLLADIAWDEHPDYRAEIAFLRVLRAQLVGVDHPGRAFLGIAIHTRYGGPPDSEPMRTATQRLLTRERFDQAVILGRALRLAFTMSGGVIAALRGTALRLDRQTVALVVPRAAARISGESVTRRLEQLAAALDRRPEIVASD